MAEVYTFHVAVKEMENKIWRDIDISSKSTLAQLSYAILVVFNTEYNHLFCLYYKGKGMTSALIRCAQVNPTQSGTPGKK